MKKALIIVFIINSIFLNWGKAQIGVGEWRDHLSFNFALAITESPTKIYAASKNGVFSYSKLDRNIEKLTKVNLLSDVGISSLTYSEENGILLVGYSNGNIDLISDNSIFNISDIKREMITGSKSINHILFIDEFAYLSCGFGIVVINLEKKEIKETYYIGGLGTLVNVNQLVLSNNYLYAATNQGVYIADYSNQYLVDYSNWQRITNLPNYSSKFNTIYVNEGKILVNQDNESLNDVIHLYSEGLWSIFNNEYSSVRTIKNTNSSIQIVTNRNILVYTTDFNFVDSVSKTEISTLNPFDVIQDATNYWIADYGNGLLKYQSGNLEVISPNAPYTSDAFAIDVDNNKVIVAAGGLSPSWGNVFINGTVYSFQNEQWESVINYSAPDYISAKIDPQNTNHYYACSWGTGLFEYTNNEITEVFNEDNSTLQTVIADENAVRVSGLAFDTENNLWVANSGVANPISVRKINGEWKSFNFEESINNILVGDIIITQNNHKWVTLPRGNGLFVFDSGQSIDTENDDLFKKFNIIDENGKLISNDVYSIAEDLDGTIWVGTNQGIVVYYNPENVFENANFHAQQIKVTIDEVTNFLLKTQVISSLAIDGANRKWIGTHNSGVYLVSEDGTEEINHFTENNSPLLSNRISDIGE